MLRLRAIKRPCQRPVLELETSYSHGNRVIIRCLFQNFTEIGVHTVYIKHPIFLE